MDFRLFKNIMRKLALLLICASTLLVGHDAFSQRKKKKNETGTPIAEKPKPKNVILRDRLSDLLLDQLSDLIYLVIYHQTIP